MFSSRRLKAIVLLVAVMAAGFVLFEPYFVQEAVADCQVAQILCQMVESYARWVCNTEGWQSAACANATGQAVRYCMQLLHECRRGG